LARIRKLALPTWQVRGRKRGRGQFCVRALHEASHGSGSIATDPSARLIPTPQRRAAWPDANGLAGNSSICHRPGGKARISGSICATSSTLMTGSWPSRLMRNINGAP
jgi:hypothetical protein